MAKRVRRSRAEREAFWRRHFKDWRQSGQTISGFCRERSLTESAFHLWKRELRLQTKPRHAKTAAPRPMAPRFVPVTVAALPTSALTLEVHGATLRIEPRADEALLRTVLKVLKGD
jgi:transposase